MNFVEQGFYTFSLNTLYCSRDYNEVTNTETFKINVGFVILRQFHYRLTSVLPKFDITSLINI